MHACKRRASTGQPCASMHAVHASADARTRHACACAVMAATATPQAQPPWRKHTHGAMPLAAGSWRTWTASNALRHRCGTQTRMTSATGAAPHSLTGPLQHVRACVRGGREGAVRAHLGRVVVVVVLAHADHHAHHPQDERAHAEHEQRARAAQHATAQAIIEWNGAAQDRSAQADMHGGWGVHMGRQGRVAPIQSRWLPMDPKLAPVYLHAPAGRQAGGDRDRSPP